MHILMWILIILSASPLHKEPLINSYFVIWNVGQGQWATRIRSDECWHFDMGGEFFPIEKIKTACFGKKNRIFLSHWDWDHIGGLRLLPKNLQEICLAAGPIGKAPLKKTKLLPPVLCPLDEHSIWHWMPNPEQTKQSNDRSQVFIKDDFLLPGDSPQPQEKIWFRQMPVNSVRFLLLGHHGSQTSTSDELLDSLPKLQLSISSARWKRYNHPHPKVLARLKMRKIPLIRTEDWGNIWLGGQP